MREVFILAIQGRKESVLAVAVMLAAGGRVAMVLGEGFSGVPGRRGFMWVVGANATH